MAKNSSMRAVTARFAAVQFFDRPLGSGPRPNKAHFDIQIQDQYLQACSVAVEGSLADHPVVNLKGSLEFKANGTATPRSLRVSGCIFMSRGAAVLCTATVDTLIHVQPTAGIEVVEARANGVRVAALIFIVQGIALRPYVEPPEWRRKQAWKEGSFFTKRWRKATIQEVNLDLTLMDDEIPDFFKYYVDKSKREGLKLTGGVLVGAGVAVGLSFIDPTGISLIVTTTGVVYKVASGLGQQYRMGIKEACIKQLANRRGLHLIHDKDTGGWYTAPVNGAMGAMKDVPIGDIMTALGALAGM